MPNLGFTDSVCTAVPTSVPQLVLFRRDLRASEKTSLTAARVTLGAIRDSADGYPPLKSVGASMVIMWDMTEVSFLHF